MGLFVLLFAVCLLRAGETVARSDGADAVEIWRSMQVRRPTPEEPRSSGRIFGGVETNITDLPYQLSLRRFDHHICGASVIDHSLAITAAHCVTPKPAVELITLKAGSTNRTADDEGQIFQASEIIIHPLYNSSTFSNDVALIRIEGNFSANPNVTPIALRTQGIFISSFLPVYCTVSGWGLTNVIGEGLPEMLRSVRIPLVPYTDCRRKWSPLPITPSMACAGELRRDACNGDSGGPLVCFNQLYGIVSWGSSQCGSSFPGVYTSIPSKDVLNFINQYMNVPQADEA